MMQKRMKLRMSGFALAAAAVICACSVRQGQAQAQAQALVLAVAEIHYVDTSGEVVDQSADHRRRLRDFEAALRGDLTASGKISNAALDCPPNACSVGDLHDSQLVAKAKEAGATHLLIGR